MLVGVGRFELPTPCSRSRCATRLRYTPAGERARYIDGSGRGRKEGRYSRGCWMLDPPRVILFPSTLSCVALFGSVHGSHDPHQAATRLCPFNAASYLAGPLHLGKVECALAPITRLARGRPAPRPSNVRLPHNIYWERVTGRTTRRGLRFVVRPRLRSRVEDTLGGPHIRCSRRAMLVGRHRSSSVEDAKAIRAGAQRPSVFKKAGGGLSSGTIIASGLGRGQAVRQRALVP